MKPKTLIILWAIIFALIVTPFVFVQIDTAIGEHNYDSAMTEFIQTNKNIKKFNTNAFLQNNKLITDANHQADSLYDNLPIRKMQKIKHTNASCIGGYTATMNSACESRCKQAFRRDDNAMIACLVPCIKHAYDNCATYMSEQHDTIWTDGYANLDARNKAKKKWVDSVLIGKLIPQKSLMPEPTLVSGNYLRNLLPWEYSTRITVSILYISVSGILVLLLLYIVLKEHIRVLKLRTKVRNDKTLFFS